MSAIIRVEALRKVFHTPLARKKVEVVKGISFTVERGEVFGFLGPNGAGKTTTIRILMGLIAATSGEAFLFDEPVPDRKARARLGFLPEAPYFYDYLTVGEMLDLAGRLFGLDRATRRRRVGELIERVGLGHARSTPLKKFSKGMLQRAGIAQALINDPELVVLDEPTSGLDAVGRKEVRDIIESLRDHGKTVFFSSHILADVEHVSDRIGIVIGGRMRDLGPLSELVDQRQKGTDVVLRLPGDQNGDTDGDQNGDADGEAGGVDEEALARLTEAAASSRRRNRELSLSLGADADVDGLLAGARDMGARVVSVTPVHETLEDLFLRRARGEGEESGQKSGQETGEAAA